MQQHLTIGRAVGQHYNGSDGKAVIVDGGHSHSDLRRMGILLKLRFSALLDDVYVLISFFLNLQLQNTQLAGLELKIALL